MRAVGDESVLLNLDTGQYFSLDAIGARMFQVITQSSSIEQAFDSLFEEFDVDKVELRTDLQELIDNLLKHGLVEVS